MSALKTRKLDLGRIIPEFSSTTAANDSQLKHCFLFSYCVFFSNNTLWGSLEEPNISNTNEFEDLFSKATLQPKKKPLSDTYEKKAKAKKVKQVAPLALPQFGLYILTVSAHLFLLAAASSERFWLLDL